MQLEPFVRIANARWAALFGGIGGGAGALIVYSFSGLSSGRAAFLVGLLTGVFSSLLMIITNLAGVMPTDSGGDGVVGDE